MLIPEFFRKFRIFCSGTIGKSIKMAQAISIPNFRIIGPLVPEKQGGGHNVSPPDRFIAQNTWTGDRVNWTNRWSFIKSLRIIIYFAVWNARHFAFPALPESVPHLQVLLHGRIPYAVPEQQIYCSKYLDR